MRRSSERRQPRDSQRSCPTNRGRDSAPNARSTLSSLRRQGIWAVVDQALSSGTNFVPSLLLARVLGPASYGAFSLAFLAWFGALTLITSALMQPYTLAAASVEGTVWRDVTKRASGAVLIAGAICGGVFAIAGAVIGTSSGLGRALLAIAILAPGLALQEFWRVASYAASRARTAAANDAYWAIGQIIAFGLLLWHGHPTVAESLFAWGAGAWLAAVIGIWQLSVMPRADLAAVRWARKRGAISAWFTLTSMTYTVGLLIVAVIIAAKLGNTDLGLYRAVQNLFGPIQLLTIGAQAVFLPHLVRRIQRASSDGFREALSYSLLMAGSVTAYGLVMLLAAPTILTKVFGPSFAPAKVLVLPAVLAYIFDASNIGAALQLRAHARGKQLAAAQLVATLTRLVAVAALASTSGLLGAAWGLVIGSGGGAVTFWAVTRGAGRRHGIAEASGHLRVADPEGRI